MSVTYDRVSTEGLTAGDMVKSISAKYGPATTLAPSVDAASIENYEAKGSLVASWEDAEYSFNLVHTAFTNRFGLVLYAKRANAEAELAMAETLRLREAGRSQKGSGAPEKAVR